MQKKYNWFFYFLLFLSSIYVVFMNSFYSIWFMMELNVIVFITYMVLNELYVSSSVIKYFLINSFSSLIFLFFMNLLLLDNKMFYYFIINLIILLKLGMFPFYLWFIDILIDLNWMNCFILLGIQKFIPFNLLNMVYIFNLMIFVSILGGFMSVLMSFNQVILKKFMGYSSINHMCWMIVSLNFSNFFFFMYYFIYLMISYVIILLFSLLNLEEINELFMFLYMNNNMYMYYLVLFFSFSGLPPFLGFLSKLFLLNYLVEMFEYIILIFLLMNSMFFMYFYLRLMYNFMMIKSYFIGLNFKKYNFKLKNLSVKFLLMLCVLMNFSFLIWIFF